MLKLNALLVAEFFVAGDPTAIWMDDDGSELGNVCDVSRLGADVGGWENAPCAK